MISGYAMQGAINWISFGLSLLITIQLTRSQFSDLINQNENILRDEINNFLIEYGREAAEMCNRVSMAEWRFGVNGSDYNKRRMREEQSVSSKFECLSWRRAINFDISGVSESNIRRQLNRILNRGHCGLTDDQHSELQHLLTIMKDIYNTARVCPYQPQILDIYRPFQPDRNLQTAQYVTAYTGYCDLKLETDLLRIFELSRSEPELRHIWSEWHNKIGPPIRNSYMRYLNIANRAAELHGYRDAGEQMRAVYEDPNIYFTVQDLWTRIQPLYRKLFTFVRMGLVKRYGEHVIRPDGPIPAHLLGNIWAQDWKNIFDIVKPGPNSMPDITGEMIRQGYTPLKIFQTSEEFFTSLGLPPMSPEFWRNSMLQRPNDSYSKCSASAWDFCNKIDYRIKQCTQISIEDYVNAHHEMCHIEYYMQYSGQSFIYRDGPNPAFHEAMANAIDLCVGGPIHLQRIGLISNQLSFLGGNTALNIEYLLRIALEKLPFLAHSLALEKWRWYVFEKGPVGMNSRWWELKLRYQGLIPPVQRAFEHFDAASKYQVINDEDYIKYFLGTILQFQFYQALCDVSNHIGPLHTCDFYRSRDAGRLMREFMQLGASLSASQLIKMFTKGKTSDVTAEPLLNFFRPLEAWLDQQIRNEPVIGWNSNIEDIELFQSMNSSPNRMHMSTLYVPLIIICLKQFL